MKLLAVLALVALAAATRLDDISSTRYDAEWLDRVTPQKRIEDSEFRAGREYQFIYNGQLMTGIPQSSEMHSATRIQALITLIFKSRTEVTMQMRHVRFGYLNDRVSNPRRMQSFEIFEQVEVDEELKTRLRAPVRFEYKSGMISEIYWDTMEQPWSANIKRAVLNMLQVNLKKDRRTDSIDETLLRRDTQEEEITRKFDFFTVMEKTLEGECETAYTTTSLPRRNSRQIDNTVLNVTKTINFEKCTRRPDIKYNFRFQDWCPTCQNSYEHHERMLKSSTVMKYNMTVSEDRERCLIESSIVESHYTFVPFTEEGNVIQTYVNQTLELVKTSGIETTVPELSSPMKSDSDMIYTPDWDIYKEKFFMDGESFTQFDEKSPYSEIKNKIEFIKSVLQKMVHHMRSSVDEEAPRQFARLVKVLRLLKREELERVHETFFKVSSVDSFTPEEHKKVKSVLPDAIALCGTTVCVEHIVEKHEQREHKPWKTSMLIRKMMQIRTPSEKMIEKIWTLTSENKCVESKVVCQSAYLTVGSLLYAMCAPNKDKLAVEFKPETEQKICPRQLKEKWVEKLFERFERCDSELCRVTVLKSVANAGLDLSIYKLEKIIRNKEHKYSENTRVEAILATRQLKDHMPRKVEKILMPIYMNKMEKPYVRMAAFHKILHSQPEKFVLDMLTRSLMHEHNSQVASWSYTMMRSMANSTNPCEKRLADDLKLSLRHSRFVPVRSWLQFSKFDRVQMHSEEKNTGFTIDFNSIMSNYSVLPKDLAASLHTNFGNIWSRYAATIGVQQNGLDDIVRRMIRTSSHNMQTSLDDLLSGSMERPSPRFNYRTELNDVYERLNIVSRDSLRESDKEAFGSLYLRWMDQEYGFLPLSKDIIPEEFIRLFNREDATLERMIRDAEKVLRDVQIPFDAQTATFLFESSRKIPTTIGLPLQLSLKMPTVFQVSGIVKVDVDETEPLKKVKVELKEFKPSLTTTLIAKIESWSPIVNTGLKVISQAKIFAPFNGHLSFDLKKTQPEVKFVWKPEQREYDVITVQTRPITTSLVWPRFLQQWQEPTEKTIQGSEWTRMNTINKEYGEHEFGVKFHTRSHWHYTPEKHVSTTPFCPLSGPNKFVVSIKPGYEMPKEIEFTLTGKLFEKLARQASVRPSFDKFFEEESDKHLDISSEEELTETETETYRKHYQQYEGRNPTRNQLRLFVETKGSSIKREALLESDCKCDESMKTCKCDIKLERTPIATKEEEKWKFECQVETLFPETPYTISELTGDKKFMCRINAKWGRQSDMKKFVDLKIVGQQSQKMRDLTERSSYKRVSEDEKLNKEFRSMFGPVGQYEQTYKYGLIDEYKIDIDYNVSPVLKNITEKLYRYAKYNYYWQTEVNSVFDRSFELKEKDQIRAKVNVDPENPSYVNITVQTPKTITKFYDIPLKLKVNPLNLRKISSPSRNWYSMISDMTTEYERGVCNIRSDRISTFDNVDYRTPISKCYSVLAKDCATRHSSKFAVMIKREDDSELKTLKIVTEQVKLVIRTISESQFECELNGERRRCEEIDTVLEHQRHTVLRVQTYNKYMQIELPEAGLRVFFDGYAINIKVSTIYRSEVCGMCGHYDYEESDEECELRTANNECVSRNSERQLAELFESYLIRDETCQFDETLLSEDRHYKYQPLTWEDERYEHIEDSERRVYRDEDEEVRPVERTRVIEQSDEVCFSKRPLPECPRMTKTKQYKQGTIKVVYSCMPRNEQLAEEYLRLASRDEIVPTVENMPASFTQDEYVPVKCVRDE
jgi:hypothetical protein